MSKRNIEKYIPTALEVLKEHYPNGVIPSAYNGYISSFGASIVQSGLKPTVALFENENNQDRTKEDKSVLTKNILKVLDKDYEDNSLLRYIVYYNGNQDILKQNIMDISIALKLTIRTFKLDKGENHE
ncbi:type III-B CRISPR module-associated protein Cmr5 [Sulfurovum sp.]|uniref:type III-B CRISPR module-associated protein Cmr5 n=1 Tax=Sulfurovum sp. TaxID=1969726 RepID=UPI0025ECE126|nr:type III-B CRISPR module-associated protein Cmr5 [Sulfurovum sp.]